MGRILLFYLGFIMYAASLRAVTEDIIVHNKSELPIYAAIYNKSAEATRFTPVKEIKPDQKNQFELPSFRTFVYRELVFSLNADDLKDVLTDEQYRIFSHQNIGTGQGYNFYVIIHPLEGILKAYNTLEWNVLRPVQDKLKQAVKFLNANTLSQLRRALTKDFPSIPKQAQVRLGTSLAPEEKAYIASRNPVVKNTLEKLLGRTIEYVPRIAVCGSGGGYRAMLSTIGFLQGAAEIEILDSIMFAAGLSGSTWALATWLHSGVPVQQMNSYFKPRINESLITNFTNPGAFAKQLLLKYSFNQPVSLVDIYGGLLASSLLNKTIKNPYLIRLSDQVNRVKDGKWILPIYTAIATKKPYEWLEFTPFEVGSDYLGGYVPAWAFGRKFMLGKSINDAPEQPLGYFMGIWGSAFAANYREMLLNLGQTLKPKFLKRGLEKTLQETEIGRQRIFPAQVFNYMLGIPTSPRAQQATLTLIDAGLDYNLPIPPLLRRDVDIIIIFDASAGNVGEELQKAQEYFRSRNITFPRFKLDELKNNICTVLKDEEDSTVPVIIYMPLIKNEKYGTFDPVNCPTMFCDTFNFKYKPEEIDLLSGLTKFNMIASKDIIVQAIKDVIAVKE